MTTVFVDFTNPKRPREIARDARDPLGDHQADVERVADTYSRSGRTIRMFAVDRYVKPWRQRKNDPLYEAHDGQATLDFRVVGS